MAAPKGHVLPHAKAWRERLWLTQQELADRAGISVFIVRRAERGGAVSVRAVRELAAALDATPEQLCREAPAQTAAAV